MRNSILQDAKRRFQTVRHGTTVKLTKSRYLGSPSDKNEYVIYNELHVKGSKKSIRRKSAIAPEHLMRPSLVIGGMLSSCPRAIFTVAWPRYSQEYLVTLRSTIEEVFPHPQCRSQRSEWLDSPLNHSYPHRRRLRLWFSLIIQHGRLRLRFPLTLQ